MHRPFMEPLDSEEGLAKSWELAKSPRVQKALAAVREAAKVSLHTDVPFRWWLLAAGAACLKPEDARYAGRLYVKLGRYQARCLLEGEEAREIRNLLNALWEFLEAHEALPEMLHFRAPEGWGRREGNHEEPGGGVHD